MELFVQTNSNNS